MTIREALQKLEDCQTYKRRQSPEQQQAISTILGYCKKRKIAFYSWKNACLLVKKRIANG